MAIGGAEAIERLEAGHADLTAAVASLTSRQIVRPGTLGGGDWSVKDLIGHIGAWERRALTIVDAWSRGEPFDALIGVGAVDELNERGVAATRQRTLRETRSDAAATHRALVERIAGLTAADLRSSVTMSTGRRHRLGTLLGSTTGGPAGPYLHMSAHLPDVRAYVASTRTEGGTIAR